MENKNEQYKLIRGSILTLILTTRAARNLRLKNRGYVNILITQLCIFCLEHFAEANLDNKSNKNIETGKNGSI